jgi:hypothetical protein
MKNLDIRQQPKIEKPYYFLYLRGPIIYSIADNIALIFFSKNPIKAGERGISLEPGCGAWLDRKINEDEPDEIFMKTYNGIVLNDVYLAFINNSNSKDYVIQLMARNAFDTNTPHYIIREKFIFIHHL